MRAAEGNKFPAPTLCNEFQRVPNVNIERVPNVNIETPKLRPSMAERVIHTATGVSQTVAEVSAVLELGINRLGDAIATARQPGKSLSTISAITREVPLTSLFVAFLFGLAMARRR